MHEGDITKLLEYVLKFYSNDPTFEILARVAIDLYDKNGNDVIDFGEETETMINEVKKKGKVSDEDINSFRNLIDASFGNKGITRAKAIAIARIFDKKKD